MAKAHKELERDRGGSPLSRFGVLVPAFISQMNQQTLNVFWMPIALCLSGVYAQYLFLFY